MDAHNSLRIKVQQIFTEAFGSRADVLKGGIVAQRCNDMLSHALTTDYLPDVADDIAFHMFDWEADAAFIVACILFPEKFTQEELQAGTDMFLVHVPAHIFAAARLGGYPSKDIFESNNES